MTDAAAVREELRRLAVQPDAAVELGEAALALAAYERPAARRDACRALLAELTRAVAARAGALADEACHRAAALSAVLVQDYRFRGDERDETLDGLDLIRVIDRRRGPALSLGIVYLTIARGLGWPAEPLSFPGHFLLRLEDEAGRRVILDAYDGAVLADAAELRARLKALVGVAAELAPEHYTPMSNRAVLLRLQNGIKFRLLREGRLERALRTVEAALLFAPEHLPLWREAGMMHLRLGDLPAAIAALEEFVARAPDSIARHRIGVLLQDLRGRHS